MSSIGIPEAIFLGALQGLTEFLPISSSGHLAVANWLLGVKDGGLALVMLVHAGTLLALAIIFRAQLWDLVRGGLRLPMLLTTPFAKWPKNAREVVFVIVATIPGVVGGLLFEDKMEAAFGHMHDVGWQFIVTGVFLFATRWMTAGSKEITWSTALWIGIAQAISILPAISRSGATIAAAIFLGVSRPRAGEFSFVISAPIILGAVLLELPKLAGAEFQGQAIPLTVAFIASAVVGALSLVWLLGVIRNGRFYWFAPYCVVLGVALLVFAS